MKITRFQTQLGGQKVWIDLEKQTIETFLDNSKFNKEWDIEWVKSVLTNKLDAGYTRFIFDTDTFSTSSNDNIERNFAWNGRCLGELHISEIRCIVATFDLVVEFVEPS